MGSLYFKICCQKFAETFACPCLPRFASGHHLRNLHSNEAGEHIQESVVVNDTAAQESAELFSHFWLALFPHFRVGLFHRRRTGLFLGFRVSLFHERRVEASTVAPHNFVCQYVNLVFQELWHVIAPIIEADCNVETVRLWLKKVVDLLNPLGKDDAQSPFLYRFLYISEDVHLCVVVADLAVLGHELELFPYLPQQLIIFSRPH